MIKLRARIARSLAAPGESELLDERTGPGWSFLTSTTRVWSTHLLAAGFAGRISARESAVLGSMASGDPGALDSLEEYQEPRNLPLNRSEVITVAADLLKNLDPSILDMAGDSTVCIQTCIDRFAHNREQQDRCIRQC